MHPRLLLPLAIAAAAAALAAPAHAAEGYSNCTNYVNTLPATISTQGTWCLNKDLATGIASGNAITVSTSNVTLDCNDFKIGGLAAGPATQTNAIYTTQNNLTVRNCNIRGFHVGTNLHGYGHVIEDNRFEGSTAAAIFAMADAVTFRRNLIVDSGGSPGEIFGAGISLTGSGDILDNTIIDVTNGDNEGQSAGIHLSASIGSVVAGNRIRGLYAPDIGQAVGVLVIEGSENVTVKDNVIYGGAHPYAYGVYCSDEFGALVHDNTIQAMSLGYVQYCTGGGNLSMGAPP